jgi:aspartate carbamoyltransferase catalytic subunit
MSVAAAEHTLTAPWSRKHLLGLEELSREEILAILDTAERMDEISKRDRKKVPALQGRIVFNLFFESSTRTRTSFSLAAKRRISLPPARAFRRAKHSLTRPRTSRRWAPT